jgi:hypothetical protein
MSKEIKFLSRKEPIIMAEKKITKREVVEMMLADSHISNNEVYVAYLKNELELLKKKSENKKATKNQTENVEIKTVILEVLTSMGKARATDIMNAVKATDEVQYATLTNQRVSAILKQMVENDGTVVKTVDKKVSTFSLA